MRPEVLLVALGTEREVCGVEKQEVRKRKPEVPGSGVCVWDGVGWYVPL